MNFKEDLIIIMNDTIDSINQMIDLQNQKIELSNQDNIAIIENIMRKEEAVLMRLRGLDKKRDDLLAANNIKNTSFIDIINDDDTKLKSSMQETYKTLKDKLDELSEKKQIATNIIKSNISKISLMLDRIDYYNSASYNQMGEITKVKTQIFASKRA